MLARPTLDRHFIAAGIAGAAFVLASSAVIVYGQATSSQSAARSNDGPQVLATTTVQSSRYGTPVRRGELSDREIVESSGLAAASRDGAAVFWTHNDSGDRARLFCFNSTGAAQGRHMLRGVTAVDWEDMAAFERDGQTWLLIGDVGDNAKRRPTCRLWWCQQPRSTDVEIAAQGLEFRYEDGPRDCEAVAVDAAGNRILLASKSWTDGGIYELPLPQELGRTVPGVAVARRIATTAIPMVVAMDCTRDGSRAVLLTYGDALEYRREATETWSAAFAKVPERITMPARRQGESICYSLDGSSLFLTSERLPTPWWEVPAAEFPPAPTTDARRTEKR